MTQTEQACPKWTEGPWSLEFGDTSHRYVHVTDAYDRTVHYKYASAGPTEADRDIANARLIAAAPALYGALNNLTMWMRTLEDIHGELKGGATQSVLDAEAALSAARGDQ